ncbi:MAG: SDR family oxidoreductase [Lachnospiraceae bacterium]|nr:SDR family oxidoreductase [Lachnospiraceae bacterium]
MANHFKGKAVIVTGSGGTAGIGRAMALRYAREGAKVVVNDFGTSEEGIRFADMVVKEIRESGGTAVANYDSVCADNGAANIIGTCIDNFGKVDVLVNNAGNHILGDPLDGTMAALDSMYNIHMKGMFACGQEAAKQMVSQGTGGSIINFSSQSSFQGKTLKGQQMLYGMVKAAILSMTWHMRLGLEQYGITVNSILPDARSKLNLDPTLNTGMGDGLTLPVSERTPEHVAAVVAYLSSEAAIQKNITGKHVYVGGADFLIYGRPFTVAGDDVSPRFFRNANKEPWTFEDLDSIAW